MTKYGAFVELEPGIVGLIHSSSLKEVIFAKGDSVNVRIRSILPLEQRVSLALVS
jgi:ribosomal protein S1